MKKPKFVVGHQLAEGAISHTPVAKNKVTVGALHSEPLDYSASKGTWLQCDANDRCAVKSDFKNLV